MDEKKFGRKYKLTIKLLDGTSFIVELPFTIEFDITRNTLTSANVASIRVYNLSEEKREKIRKNINDFGNQKLIELQAGYGNKLSTIFSGYVTQAWSVREGTNFVTNMESFDGGFAFNNSAIDMSFPSGTTQKDVAKGFIDSMSKDGIKMGAIGNFEGTLSRGNSYSGNTIDILKQTTGGSLFIDNNKAYILQDNECLEGPIPLINKASGLLGTPVREQTIINFDMLFEPGLFLAQQIKLESETGKNFNGNYKIISLKHRGMISDAVCGTAITTVGLFSPYETNALTTVSVVQ